MRHLYSQRNTPKRLGGWVGRKKLMPLILIAEKKDSFLVVGVSPLSTAQGAGDLSQQDLVGAITCVECGSHCVCHEQCNRLQ